MEMNVLESVGGDKKQLTLSNKSAESLKWKFDLKSLIDLHEEAGFA